MTETKTECPACKERGKTWSGDDPKCAFDEVGNFDPNNWNCATMNTLRSIGRELNLSRAWHCRDDDAAGSIQVIHIPSSVDAAQGYLVMNFYKRRGRTDQAWVMNEDLGPIPLTLEIATAMIEALRVAA